MSSKYPLVPSLKLFYVDNVPYIVVETFSNINIFASEKIFHLSFDAI